MTRLPASLASLCFLLGMAPGAAAQEDPVHLVADALARHPVVALGENHGHLELHRLILTILAEPRVQSLLDDIAVEFGNSLYQEVMDRYVAGEAVPWDSVTLAWRNTVVSPNTVWDAPVYADFFRSVRALNQARTDGGSYRVLLADVPVEWEEVTSPSDLGRHGSRARHMADVVRNASLRQGRRTLLLAGGAHTVHRNRVHTRNGIPTAEVTAVGWLDLLHPGVTYVVQSFGQAVRLGLDGFQVADGPQVVRLTDDPQRAALPANASTTMRNFDGTPFTAYGDATLGELVDAVLLWSPDQMTFPDPPRETYADDAYWAALNRRSRLLRGEPMDAALRDPGS